MGRSISIASVIWLNGRNCKKRSKPCWTRKRRPPKRKRSRRRKAGKTRKRSRTRKRNLPNPEMRQKASKELPDDPENADDPFGSKENSRANYRSAPCSVTRTPSFGAARSSCLRDQRWKDLYVGRTGD